MLEKTKRIEEKPELHIVVALARAMRNISFYNSDHPMVRLNIEESHHAIDRLLGNKSEFILKVVDGELIADDQPMFDTGTGTANLVGACLRREIESITFSAGMTVSETAALINVLVADPDDLERQNGAGKALARLGASHVRLEKLLAPSNSEERTVETGRKTYASALDVLRTAARRACMGTSPEHGPANEVVNDLIDSIIYEQAAMLGLVSVKGRDEYTFTHALHICILCLELGHSLDLEREKLQEVGVCAMLHDIGKIFVPLPILRKPAALSRSEFDIIQQHPVHGALLLCRHENAPAMAPLVAFEHHLHYDYSGYPKVKHNRELNMYSLMVGPADVYDALTTDRPYRPALPPQKALEVMHSQASHFEPRLLARFTEMLGKYPAGSLLRLTDGRLAVVTRPNPRYIDLPFVRILELTDGAPVLLNDEIDLSAKNAEEAFLHSIDATIDPATLNINVSTLMGGNVYCTE